MTSLIVGVILGILAVLVSARFAGPTVGAILRKLSGAGPDSEFLRLQEVDFPAHAELVRREPAVPVEDQPSEITAAAVAGITSSTSQEEAVLRLGKFAKNPDVANVLALVARWQPRRFQSEERYQTSFRRFIAAEKLSDELIEHPHAKWGADGTDATQSAYPDFVFGNTAKPDKRRVLIELKADLFGAASADRAMGQMLRYLLAWKAKGPSILVVCGNSSPEVRFLVRLYIDAWRRNARLPVTVFFKRDVDEQIEERSMMHMDNDE